MNKASVTKKTLSVFLSVLMMLSCCVTAAPWLADTFGLKARATASTAQIGALTTAVNKAITLEGTAGLSKWSKSGDNTTSRSITDTSDHGVIYPIVIALFSIVIADTNTGNATSLNNPSRVKTQVNSDIDSATTNSTARTQLKSMASLICDYSAFSYYYSTQASQDSDASGYGAHYWHDDYTTVGDDSANALSAIDDYAVTVTRTKEKAMMYYSLYSGTPASEVLPANVGTSRTLTFDIGKDYHHWTNKGGVLNLFTRDNDTRSLRYHG